MGKHGATLFIYIFSPAWEKIEDTFNQYFQPLVRENWGQFLPIKIRTCDIAYWVSLPVCDSCKLLGTVSFYHIIVIITPQGVEVEELLNKDEHLVTTDVLQKNNKN